MRETQWDRMISSELLLKLFRKHETIDHGLPSRSARTTARYIYLNARQPGPCLIPTLVS